MTRPVVLSLEQLGAMVLLKTAEIAGRAEIVKKIALK